MGALSELKKKWLLNLKFRSRRELARWLDLSHERGKLSRELAARLILRTCSLAAGSEWLALEKADLEELESRLLGEIARLYNLKRENLDEAKIRAQIGAEASTLQRSEEWANLVPLADWAPEFSRVVLKRATHAGLLFWKGLAMIRYFELRSPGERFGDREVVGGY